MKRGSAPYIFHLLKVCMADQTIITCAGKVHRFQTGVSLTFFWLNCSATIDSLGHVQFNFHSTARESLLYSITKTVLSGYYSFWLLSFLQEKPGKVARLSVYG